MKKPLHQTFNDGFLQYGYSKTGRSDRGKRIGGQFQKEGVLAYHLMNARDEDYRLAGFLGVSLDLKVMTRFPPSFSNISKSKLVCMIGDKEYDVIKVDNDNDKRYLYFYLQEVGATSE
jgi:hypothetical protein